MKDAASVPGVNERIAERIRELRAAQRLSLDAIASKSGVSRSMISLIERGESSPTAVVLERLATGLGVPLASLFDPPSAVPRRPAELYGRRIMWGPPLELDSTGRPVDRSDRRNRFLGASVLL